MSGEEILVIAFMIMCSAFSYGIGALVIMKSKSHMHINFVKAMRATLSIMLFPVSFADDKPFIMPLWYCALLSHDLSVFSQVAIAITTILLICVFAVISTNDYAHRWLCKLICE